MNTSCPGGPSPDAPSLERRLPPFQARDPRPAPAEDEGDELQMFADDEAPSPNEGPAAAQPALPPWRILIVDDDAGIHQATLLALGLQSFRGRNFQFLSAYSAAEACTLLASTPDIALVLLDVVMETDDAGLRLVHTIRHGLNCQLTRILLRTGQPGLAPQQQVIVDYDIDDYRNKAELTGAKLFAAVVSALRAYDTLRAMADQQAELHATLKKVRHLEQALNEHAIVAVSDGLGRLSAANERLCDLAGAPVAQLLAQQHQPLRKHGEALGHEGLSLRDCLAQGRVWHGELIHPQADGSHRWAETTVLPLADDTGRPSQHIIVATEVTEARLARQQILDLNRDLERRVQRRTTELEEAKRAAEAANHAKSIFLANMSHEIRTPLNAVLGYAQLLSRDPRLPPALRSIVAPIEKSGTHLLTLINDILDLSKIEAGGMSLDLVDLDLAALAAEMGDMFALRCAQKGIGWRCELELPSPCVLRGDAGKLRQVLLNLLSNAVKFTDCGEVLLRIRARAEAGAAGLQLCFEVSDTGLGIPQAQQDLVFAPFHQADAGAQRGGTGLGLAISSRQVELMGGQPQLQSAEGQGSRFSFQLQLAPGEHSKLPQDSGFGALVSLSEGQVLRVLVVDDIEANRDVLARMLIGLGADVRQAEHGLQALQMLKAAPARFDIVFLDIRMPVLDGIETLKRLRRELPQPQPVVVALTASALMHERQSYMREGFDDFIGKPFLFETVHQLLRQHLGPLFRPESLVTGDAHAAAPGTPAAPPQGCGTPRVPAGLLQQLQAAAETGWISELERGIEALLRDCPAEQALGERLLDCLRQYDMARLQRELQVLAATDGLPA